MHFRGFICLVFIFIASALGQFCFKNRVPAGQWGQCQYQIRHIDTMEKCCQAGGAGWTNKANGKRCRAACLNNGPPSVVQPLQPVQPVQPAQPNKQLNPSQPATGEVKFCFRTLQPHGRFGFCEELIGEHTQEDCCRRGGKGWTDKENGKRCEDACEGVVDDGPSQHCFRRRTNRGHCKQSFGQKTRLDCCQEGGVGWSANANGQDCGNPCELATPVSPPEPDEPVQYCFSHRSNSGRCLRLLGEKTRSQCCQDGGNGWSANQNGRPCEEPCQGPPAVLAPINGEWSEWSNWGQCSVTCQEGIQTRRRTCDNPAPAHGGNYCIGRPLQHAVCFEGPCPPIHGGWGDWQDAGECSATCYHEGKPIYRQSSRKCDNPRPQFGGRRCKGPTLRNERCLDLPHCPVPGGWSDWGPWRPCSGSCRRGDFRLRFRICNNPPPQYGGSCEGNYREFGDCENLDPCPNNIGEGSDSGGAESVNDVHGSDEDVESWNPSTEIVDEGEHDSFSYSVDSSIGVQTDEASKQEGCQTQDYSQYSNGAECQEDGVDGQDADEQAGGEGSDSGGADFVNHVHGSDEDVESWNPSTEILDEGEHDSFSYSLETSIDVPRDGASIQECQDYSQYSNGAECQEDGVDGQDADEQAGGSQLDGLISYDYGNLGNPVQGNPEQGNPDNEGDNSISLDYEYSNFGQSKPVQGNSGREGDDSSSIDYGEYGNFGQGNPGQGNGGHGGAQLGVPQGAAEGNSIDYSDSYSFDDGVQVNQGGVQPIVPQPPVEENDGDSSIYSFNDSADNNGGGSVESGSFYN